MKKQLTIVIALIYSSFLFSQTGLKINPVLTMTDYYSMRILSAKQIEGKIHVACSVQDQNSNKNHPVFYTIENNKIISKIRLKPKDELLFFDIKIINDHLLLIGNTFTGNDEEQQGYIGCFDFHNNELWKVKLEKHIEGTLNVFPNEQSIDIITSGDKGLFGYKVSYQGKILSKTAIPLHNYILNSIQAGKSGFIILSDSLSSNGKSIGMRLTKCDANFKIVTSQKVASTNDFMPVKLLEYPSGFILAGNIDLERAIPCIYFINKDLTVLKVNRYHFEPEHYLFKSSFRLSDIYYDKIQNDFIASGVAKIVNDNTNIIFVLTQDKLLSHTLLEKCGLWGSSLLIELFDNKYDLVSSYKIHDDFDIKIKISEIKR